MSAHLEELIALVQSAGGTVRLYGCEVSARELRTFAWSGFMERFADEVVRAAARRMCVPRDADWTPYPMGCGREHI